MDRNVTRSYRPTPALKDMVEGWRMKGLWLTLAWDDLRVRYRRSVLGPAWITLATGFFIAVVSYLFAGLLNRDVHVLVPWLSTGLTMWQFLTSMITEGTTTFIREAGIIQNVSMPLSTHVYRMVTRHLLNYLHNFVIVIAALALFPPEISLTQLLFIPGLIIILLTAVAASLFLGIIGARFRDFSHTVAMLMSPIFILTPVLWMPDMVAGARLQLTNLNPFTHFIAIVREPLLGRAPQLINYEVSIGIMIMLMVAALLMLNTYRARIAYWL